MSKFYVTATWDDAPHLTKDAKEQLWNSIPAYQRDARSKGIPSLGAGAIYGVPESDYVVDDFPIPEHWPRGFGLDVGWNRTAAIWGALDRDSDCLTLYSEHYRGEAEASIHAAAMRGRGKWIRGATDPAARGRSQVDGRSLIQLYKDLGLDLTEARHAVEASIYMVHERITTGRLRVFKSCRNWLSEVRLYRRDQKGRIVKERDHLMDATRYLVIELHNIVRTKPAIVKPDADIEGMTSSGWMY